MALPGLNYAVLDTNRLTDASTIATLQTEYRATGQLIVLPWTHVFEQSKGEQEESFHRNHNHLRLLPEAVALAKDTITLNQEERRSLRPVQEIADERNTSGLRGYLAGSGLDFPHLHTVAVELFRRMNPVEGWVRKLADTLTVDAPVAKAIRSGLQSGDRSALCTMLVGALPRATIEAFIASLLEANGVSTKDVPWLSSFPSFHALTFMAHLCLAARTKFQTAADEDDNHAADVEAVVIALYGRRLMSVDKLALELDEDMRIIARTIWA